MDTSWHLLLENLRNNPELLEEDMREDAFALSAQENEIKNNKVVNSESKRKHIVKSLQKKYGNQGLQKLLIKTINNPSNIKRKKMEAIHNLHFVAYGKVVETTSSLNLNEAKGVGQTGSLSAVKSEAVNMIVLSDEKTTSGKNNLQREGKPYGLFALFLHSLPKPSKKQLDALNRQYVYLDSHEQEKSVENMSSYIWRLPKTQKSEFLDVLKILSSNTSNNVLLLALLASLYRILSTVVDDVDDVGEET